jgi:hypothetical protein
MLASELINFVSCQSERLSEQLFQRFATAAQYADLQKIPSRQLRSQALHVCRDFGEWLKGASDIKLEDTYIGLGVDRQSQGVALSHLVASLHLTRDQIIECAAHVPSLTGTLEAHEEFTRTLNEFFDRVVSATIVGYERGLAQERHQLRAS